MELALYSGTLGHDWPTPKNVNMQHFTTRNVKRHLILALGRWQQEDQVKVILRLHLEASLAT